MTESVQSRDAASQSIESLEATSSQLQSEEALLTEEVASLSADIAALGKALNEATTLRNEESTENSKTIATATEGKNAVDVALHVLGEFYGSFLQAKYVPPDSDREGKTVGDRAPEIWEGEYSGKSADSKGILGLLEVIKSDFERTIETVTSEEKAAQEEFSAFEDDTNTEISAKTSSKGTKEKRITDIKVELADTSDALAEQKTLLADALKALDSLKAMCVDGEETYAERVAKREKEIEALKQAHQILEDWTK